MLSFRQFAGTAVAFSGRRRPDQPAEAARRQAAMQRQRGREMDGRTDGSVMLKAHMALMKQAVIPEFFARLEQAIPQPETELEYDNVYQLLVAVVLSAQATDAGVNRATTPLFEIVKTPAEMVALGERKLIGYIKTIGLF